MTISLVGQAGVNWPGSGTSSQAVTYSSTGGNTLILCFSTDKTGSSAQSGLSITDSASNTWHWSAVNANNPPYEGLQLSGQWQGSFVAWCIGASAVTSVTMSMTNGEQWQGVLSEWSGIVSADTGAAAGDAVTTTTITSPSISLADAGDLVIGQTATNAGLSSTTGTTFSSDSPNSCYDLPGTTGPFTFSWGTTSGVGYAAAVMAFSPTSGSAQVDVSTATLSVAQGSQGAYGVTLSAAPGSDVTVATSVTSGNTGVSVAAGASLTFTPSTWNVSQQVLVTADHAGAGDAILTSAASGYTSATCTVTETPQALPFSVFSGTLPADAGSALEADSLDIGIQFEITDSDYQLSGYYWYLPSGTGDQDPAHYSFRLYSTTNGTTGTLVGSTTVTASGTWAANEWNYVPLGSPVALSSGTTYVAACTTPAGFDLEYDTSSNFWTSGGIGSGGLTSGPVLAPGHGAALGGNQQPFNDPSTGGFPTSQTFAFYGIDVKVTHTSAGPQPLGAPSGGPWVLAFADDFDTPHPTVYGTGPDPAVWADSFVNGLRIATAADSLEWGVRGYYACTVGNSVLGINAVFQDPQTVDPTCPDPMDTGGNTGLYTSGIASSYRGFNFTYGYVEAAIRNTDSAAAAGTWPAFWMMPKGGPQIPPEIDIAEWDPPGNSDQMHQGYDNSSGTWVHDFITLDGANPQRWHVFGLRLDPANVTFFVDGEQTNQIAYDGNAFAWAVQFNNAVHSNTTGAGFPQTYEVDYMRFWGVDGVPDQPAITGLSPASGIPSAGSAAVSFSTVSGATSYRVTACITDQWDFDGADSSTAAVTASGSSSPITVTGLTNGAPYNFTVAAINSTGYSIESLPVPSLAPASGSGLLLAAFP